MKASKFDVGDWVFEHSSYKGEDNIWNRAHRVTRVFLKEGHRERWLLELPDTPDNSTNGWNDESFRIATQEEIDAVHFKKGVWVQTAARVAANYPPVRFGIDSGVTDVSLDYIMTLGWRHTTPEEYRSATGYVAKKFNKMREQLMELAAKVPSKDEDLDNSNADWDQGEVVTDGSPTLEVTKGLVKVKGTLEVEDLQVNGTLTADSAETVEPEPEQPILFDRLQSYSESGGGEWGPYILVDSTPDDMGRLGYYCGYSPIGETCSQDLSRLFAATLTIEEPPAPTKSQPDELDKIRKQYAGSITEANEKGFRQGFAKARRSNIWTMLLGHGIALVVGVAVIMFCFDNAKESALDAVNQSVMKTQLQKVQSVSPQKEVPQLQKAQMARTSRDRELALCPKCKQMAKVLKMKNHKFYGYHLFADTDESCAGTLMEIK